MAGADLPQLRLHRVEHRLAVRVPLLVVAHLAELGRRQTVEPALHLRGSEVVVAENREARPDACRAARTVGLGEHRIGLVAGALGGSASCFAHLLASALRDGRPALQEPLEVTHHGVGLLAAARHQTLDDRLRILGGHPAALDRLVHDLLDAVARDHDQVERTDDALRDGIAQLGDVLAREVEAACRGSRRLPGRARALLGLLLPRTRLAAGARPMLAGGGASRRGAGAGTGRRARGRRGTPPSGRAGAAARAGVARARGARAGTARTRTAGARAPRSAGRTAPPARTRRRRLARRRSAGRLPARRTSAAPATRLSHCHPPSEAWCTLGARALYAHCGGYVRVIRKRERGAALWRLHDLEAAGEQVVDRIRGRGRRQPEALRELLEDLRLARRAQVQIAAEEQGELAGPLDRLCGRTQHLLARTAHAVDAAVQVRDRERARS